MRAQVLDTFPGLSNDLWSSMVSPQSDISVVRALTHCGTQVVYYLCDRIPLLIEVSIEQQRYLVPTVYFLWRAPDLLPTMVTHDPVVERLRAGADLMLPGVIVDRRPGRPPYGRLTRGQLVSVATVTNRAPVGVGVTARCSDDMYMSGGRGKAVLLLHVVGDYLWREGSRCAIPQLGVPDLLAALNAVDGAAPVCDSAADRKVGVEHEVVDATVGDVTETVEALSLREFQETCDDPRSVNEEKSESAVDMDQLLYDAFRQACKCYAKKIEFPILVSSFYAKYMQPNSSVSLDVKKSSYKKISKFLDSMQKKSLVEVKELSKGVQSIISINVDHPEIQKFRVIKFEKETAEEGEVPAPKGNKFHTKPFESITELYAVSGNVAPLFKMMKANKGDVFSAGEVRQLITTYVKTHQLVDPDSKTHVLPDAVLTQCVLGQTSAPGPVTWSHLHETCLLRMSPVYRLQLAGEKPLLRRGAVPCIEISTAIRSGNKKVTHVLNLPVFGIDPHEFAHRCQVGVGASTSVGDAAHRTSGTVQLMVQGNQVRFVGQLLQEQYCIPKRFISGLDKASKK